MPSMPPTHRPAHQHGERAATRQRYDATRGSAAARGYDHDWRRFRLHYLRDNPLCVTCMGDGLTVSATEVDHNPPLTGPDDPGRLDEGRVQALCKPCHSRKTAGEQGGQRAGECGLATVVYGPPGGGKSTYVRERAKWGDVVLDLDQLWCAISGQPYYDKPVGLLPIVRAAYDSALATLAAQRPRPRAWVIGTLPRAADRERVERLLQPSVCLVLVDPGERECLLRISRDERRASRAAAWEPIVREWYATAGRSGTPPTGGVSI